MQISNFHRPNASIAVTFPAAPLATPLATPYDEA